MKLDPIHTPPKSAAQPAPQPEPQSLADTIKTVTPGVIILQWLTYAFWGWLIVSLVWLTSIVLTSFMLSEAVNFVIPYVVAVCVVLLPLAFVCDFLYRKHEPLQKTGGTAIIMIIHAVLFAIFGIGSLIIAVFTAVSIVTGSSASDAQTITAITSVLALLLYGAAFLRTLNPFKKSTQAFMYSIVMLALTVLLLGAAIVGPIARSVQTHDDRLIENNLQSVSTAVDSYILSNKELPTSLDQISPSSSEAKDLIDNNKVEFVSVGKIDGDSSAKSYAKRQDAYRYQLCVTYKMDNESDKRDSYGGLNTAPYIEYKNHISTKPHDSGRVCYKVEQAISNNSYDYNY